MVRISVVFPLPRAPTISINRPHGSPPPVSAASNDGIPVEIPSPATGGGVMTAASCWRSAVSDTGPGRKRRKRATVAAGAETEQTPNIKHTVRRLSALAGTRRLRRNYPVNRISGTTRSTGSAELPGQPDRMTPTASFTERGRRRPVSFDNRRSLNRRSFQIAHLIGGHHSA